MNGHFIAQIIPYDYLMKSSYSVMNTPLFPSPLNSDLGYFTEIHRYDSRDNLIEQIVEAFGLSRRDHHFLYATDMIISEDERYFIRMGVSL